MSVYIYICLSVCLPNDMDVIPCKASNDLVSHLTELDDLIDEEKRKWKQMVRLVYVTL